MDGSLLSMSFLTPDFFPLDRAHSRRLAGFATSADYPALGLPPPVLQFPVQTPHRVASDLSKLEGLPLAQDDLFTTYLARKLTLLQQRADTLLLPEPPLGAGIWEEIWQRLGLHQATWTRALGLEPKFAPQLGAQVGLNNVDPTLDQLAWAQQLTLAMQEDWVLISPGGRFEAGSVCFPSGWVPSEKFNLSLAEIHGPVADGAALRKASEVLARAMLQKGPFQRYVWTLTRNHSLPRHPQHSEDLQAEHSQALYFRYERQTTLALPGSGRALFLIHVYVVPLETALMAEQMPLARDKNRLTMGANAIGSDGAGAAKRAGLRAERLSSLKSSLSSMSEAVIAYKGLGEIREQVLTMREN